MTFRKPQTFPLLFIVVAFTTLFTLGVWQLQRLQWKNNLIAAVQHGQSLPALGTLPVDLNGLEYRKVMLTGTFMHDKAMHLVGQRMDSAPGFFIITPLTLEDDGRIILVNRGHSPSNRESRPEGVQTVEGIIRPQRPRRPFMPDNVPDKNLWFFEDIAGMSQAAGVDISPVVVEQVGPAQKDVYPVPGNGNITLRNDHLNYAITWFSLAAISLIMFAVYHKQPVTTPAESAGITPPIQD
jgi:surfeit locus 1 family protein